MNAKMEQWIEKQTLGSIRERLRSMADFAWDALAEPAAHVRKLEGLHSMLIAEINRIDQILASRSGHD